MFPCEKCDFVIKDKYYIPIHIKRAHGPLQSCEKCDYVTSDPFRLKEHVDVKHEGVVHRCHLCNATFTCKSNITQHIKTMHGSQIFVCKECDYQGKTQRHLTVHYGLWHKEKNFTCKYCDFKAGYQFHINRHMKKRHLKIMNSDERKKFNIQKCPYCDYEVCASNMKKHIQSHKNKIYSCQYCKFSTEILKIFHDHTRSIHPKVALICNECSFNTKSEAMLKDHVKSKHSDILFKCNDCNFETGVKRKFKLHQKKVHTALVFKCQICENYQCKSRDTFRNHTVRTHKMKKYAKFAVNNKICSYCGTIPETKTLYQIHLYWKHTKNDLNKPFSHEEILKKSNTTIKEEKIQETRSNYIENEGDQISDDEELQESNKHDMVKDYEDTTDIISDDEDENSKETLLLDREIQVSENFEYHISDDEEDSNIKNSELMQEGNFRFMCPISSCSFFVTDNDKQKRLAHLESKHKYTDGKIFNFIKL